MILNIILLVLVYYIFKLVIRHWKENAKSIENLPPGPVGIPILGNLPSLLKSTIHGEAPFLTFSKWALKYGPICTVQFALQRVIIVSDAQIAQQLCVSQADNFSDRPLGLLVARVLKEKGIVFNNGVSWKKHRSFILQEFRKFGVGRHSIEDRISRITSEYLQQIEKIGEEAHDPHLNLAVATYNIIWSIISGDCFSWDDPFLHKLMKNLETNLQAVELVGPHNYVGLIMTIHLIWNNVWRVSYIVIKRLKYFWKLIENQKRKSSHEDESMISDYLQRMADTKDNNEDVGFSKFQLLFLISDLFIAGGETTITTFRWIFFTLALRRDIQEKIQQQMIQTIGLESSLTYEDRKHLPYLEAFIHEIWRYFTITPGMWRNTAQDTKCQDYNIPKDTWILLHFFAMNRNPRNWTDPDDFRPDRFLNDEGKFKKSDHFLPFSTGRRQCPGESLAKMEVFLMIGSILQKYSIELAPGQNLDMNCGHFGVTYTPPDFKIILKKLDIHSLE